MSYRSRLYNHRNAQSPEAINEKPFFSKHHDGSEKNNKSAFFQGKLAINKPGDQYEREADNVAHTVVNNKNATPVLQQKKISNIQRLSTTPEEEKVSTNDQRMDRDKEKPFQRMPAEPEKDKLKGIQKMDEPEKEKMKNVQKKDDPEKEKMKGIQKMDEPMKEEEDKKKKTAVQTKQDGTAAGIASSQVASKIEGSAGKGNPLPKNTLHEMASSFGADFRNVRIHKDSEAAALNKELHAQAFTHGSDIYFNEGKYNPESSEGKFLLAHELTHVVQQNGNLAGRHIQKDDDDNDNSKEPTAPDPTTVQPGGPLDVNDQIFTLKRKSNGQWEGCAPLPGTAAGGDNACFSADSIDQIKNYFKKKQQPVTNVDRPKNCPPNRWNLMYNYCCPLGKHIDPDNKVNCISDVKPEERIPLPPPVPEEKGDFEIPDTDTQVA